MPFTAKIDKYEIIILTADTESLLSVVTLLNEDGCPVIKKLSKVWLPFCPRL
jgi:hypothetical protein